MTMCCGTYWLLFPVHSQAPTSQGKWSLTNSSLVCHNTHLLMLTSQKQFIDASDVGVGAVSPNALIWIKNFIPVPFSLKSYMLLNKTTTLATCQLSFPWRNGNIGWKLLRTHSLFGLIIRIYLKSARRLYSCQAGLVLCFGRFNFIISYHPSSRNIKPDALSRQFTSSESSKPNTVLSSSCVLASLCGKSKAKSDRHSRKSMTLAMVHLTGCM